MTDLASVADVDADDVDGGHDDVGRLPSTPPAARLLPGGVSTVGGASQRKMVGKITH